MKKLIEALTIFAKYIGDKDYPTHCEHDNLHVACDPELVSKEDTETLETLSFYPDENDGFSSSRFGSC